MLISKYELWLVLGLNLNYDIRDFFRATGNSVFIGILMMPSLGIKPSFISEVFHLEATSTKDLPSKIQYYVFAVPRGRKV